jgi:hypothetical protein
MTVRYDHDRARRIGMPEAVLCAGKSDDQLRGIVDELRGGSPVLFTRMSAAQHDAVPDRAGLDYDPASRTALLNGSLPERPGQIAVVTAGTSDLPVAGEAVRTLEFLGFSPVLISDVGVAGLWRLQERLDDIAAADVVIVVAGMDAALASVVGSLVGQPIIAVPTSTGYGVARAGETALHAMLASCAQGVAVVNIDNGFGAACAAARIWPATART